MLLLYDSSVCLSSVIHIPVVLFYWIYLSLLSLCTAASEQLKKNTCCDVISDVRVASGVTVNSVIRWLNLLI